MRASGPARPMGARLFIKIVPKYLQPIGRYESEFSLDITSISDDKCGLSIKVVMDVRIVQILKNAVVICEANSCQQTSLDPVDHKTLHRFVRDDLGN